MSYETMEALLVTKIAGVRKTEALFAQSLKAARNGASIDLDAVQQRIEAELHDVEQLLAAMESSPAVATGDIAALVAAQPIQPSVWV